MIGLIFFGVIIGYILLAVFTTNVAVRIADRAGVSKKKRMALSWIMIFLFLLIPFWDWIPTMVYHQHLCNTEAGVKIYRSVEGVEGYYGTGSGALYAGYQYGYGDNHLGGYLRFRNNPDKSSFKPWIEEPAPEPPLYGVKYEQIKLNKWNAWKIMHTVYVVKTGEVLATLTDFGATVADPNVPMSEWYRPWMSQRSCLAKSQPEQTELYKKMILETLKPAKNEH
jgi:hypothetical protein